jgi:hypothetical protein
LLEEVVVWIRITYPADPDLFFHVDAALDPDPAYRVPKLNILLN